MEIRILGEQGRSGHLHLPGPGGPRLNHIQKVRQGIEGGDGEEAKVARGPLVEPGRRIRRGFDGGLKIPPPFKLMALASLAL